MWRFRPPEARFFDPTQRKQVEVLFDAIFPGSGDSPGAEDADAAEYLDRLLAMDKSTYFEIPNWQAQYPPALAALDSACQALNGAALVDCSRDQITALLKALSGATLAGIPATIDQKKLFALLRGHCLEACFADPRWGGNKDAVIWKWMGYPNPVYDANHPEAVKNVV